MSPSDAAAGAAAATAAVSQSATEQAYDNEAVNQLDPEQIQKRYSEERSKRLKPNGVDQYVDVSLSDKFRHFQDDPFVDPATVKDAQSMFPDDRCQVLVLGAGFGGLMYAVRLIQAGVRPSDLRIVDHAGGFGGTWYYNRYPGLMCDIESYTYLPLLEETGYMPKHRYSYGHEIRDYANLVAKKYGIDNSAVFQTKAEKLEWQESTKEWEVDLVQTRKGQPPKKLNVRSQFVVTANGVLNWPKIPNLPGVLDFKGDTFHSSRWEYSITGGSQEDPSLTKLRDKRVAIVGTGCTSVQAVPELAKWAKHLYVVQRTPSTVGHRGQRETDPEKFRNEIANGKSWQRERMRNFHQHFTIKSPPPKQNLVDDEWTRTTSLVGLSGSPEGPFNPEELPEYMKTLNEIDTPLQEAIRARIGKLVKDPDTAEKLKPWYPTWCKRPAFHDDYLDAFNRDNVTLISTEGKDLDRITENSIEFDGQSYPVDVIIWATGFRPPFSFTPAEKGNMKIIGRDGVSMSDDWMQNTPSTLHGIISQKFPNLLMSGPWQAGTSPNYLFGEDQLAQHAAYVWSEAKRRADGKHFSVAPTPDAAKAWGEELLMRSAPTAAILGCTPGYFNLESQLDAMATSSPEAQMQMGKTGLWGAGIEDFLKTIEAWRAEGSMKGIEVLT
ncbi:monooxygenase [Myriangium duriaei CBS 260.36]|uniref:Monooxygenase n=1 Tax=Myriangium duriaei CBS 260.36 TaxID=1168546 RepID=A0A9P4IXK6_9PEZI|nr:monooxygenase [Myriangium duriaei CBS 260.36]